MNRTLQNILIISSILFFAFIVNMVRGKKLELKYALVWILTSFSFIILSVFPGIIQFMSALLHIKEPVNSLFLSILFFLLVTVFTLTISLSRNANRVKTLIQEMGILKLELDELKQENKKLEEKSSGSFKK